jgi:uncharacterized protein (TIGR02996 family)
MATGEIARLESEILRNPDDTELRRRIADALDAAGDPRGELIRVQLRIQRWRCGQDEPIAELDQREKALLAEHGARWAAGVDEIADRYDVRRGYVERVTLPAQTFIDHHQELYRRAPIRHLVLTEVVGAERVFGSRALARITSIAISKSKIGDRGARAIASSPHLGKLRWLGLSFCGIGREGLEALAASDKLPSLQYLGFRNNSVPDPTPRTAGADFHGKATDSVHPAEGKELMRRFGARPWLSIEPLDYATWPPDPDCV